MKKRIQKQFGEKVIITGVNVEPREETCYNVDQCRFNDVLHDFNSHTIQCMSVIVAFKHLGGGLGNVKVDIYQLPDK